MEIVKFLFIVDLGVYLWYYLSIETRKQIIKKSEVRKMTVREYMNINNYSHFSIISYTLERGYIPKREDIKIGDLELYKGKRERIGRHYVKLRYYYSNHYLLIAYLNFY